MIISLQEYNSVHAWSRRNLIKDGYCHKCGKVDKTQWSNIDHRYIREVKFWLELCVKCHVNYDIHKFGPGKRWDHLAVARRAALKSRRKHRR